MSKSANPGELRTPVYFMESGSQTDSEGYPAQSRSNVFGEGNAVMAKWVNAHGSESFTAMQLQLREPATLTVRYSPLIHERLLVYKAGEYEKALQAKNAEEALERAAYEVISIDNVEERNRWLEIKVQRKAAAR